MRKFFLLLALVLMLTNIAYSQVRYITAYHATFYVAGKQAESNKTNITFALTPAMLTNGTITFWFYGTSWTLPDGTFAQWATPDDGSGDCRVYIKIITPHTSIMKIEWGNLIIVYMCRQ